MNAPGASDDELRSGAVMEVMKQKVKIMELLKM